MTLPTARHKPDVEALANIDLTSDEALHTYVMNLASLMHTFAVEVSFASHVLNANLRRFAVADGGAVPREFRRNYKAARTAACLARAADALIKARIEALKTWRVFITQYAEELEKAKASKRKAKNTFTIGTKASKRKAS